MSSPRVWEPFITDVERTLYREYNQESKWGQRPAVLVIDIYNCTLGDRPEPVLEAVRRFPKSTGERAWQALPHVQRLLAAARSQGVPVIYTTKDPRPESRTPVWRSTKRKTDTTDWGWEYAIADAVRPQPGEPVIYKPRASGFFGTPLSAMLTQLQVDTVLVVGESTSGCVRASVVESFSHGYTTVVVEEGVWDRSWVAHCMNLFDMHHKYADVVSADKVLAYLEQLPARDR